MIKEISISGKKFAMDNSMWSHKLYVENFGSDMFKDISKIKDMVAENKGNVDLALSSDVINIVLQVAYSMVANKDESINWKDFLKQIDSLTENSEWVLEVLGFATMFQGKLQSK